MRLLLFLILPLLMMQCKSNKSASADADSDTVEIIFGSSGGFAGQVTQYKLNEYGDLYKQKGIDGEYQHIKKIKKRIAQQFIDNYTKMGFDKTEVDDPGNMTYYITIQQGGRRRKLRWGGQDEQIPDNLQLYYDNCMNLVNKSKSK